MKTRIGAMVVVLALTANTQALAQRAGSAVSLQYGTVESVTEIKAAPRHARGGLLGGVAGAALAGIFTNSAVVTGDLKFLIYALFLACVGVFLFWLAAKMRQWMNTARS